MKFFAPSYIMSSIWQRKRNVVGLASDKTGDPVEMAQHKRARRFPLRAFSLFWLALLAGSMILASGFVPKHTLSPVTGNGGRATIDMKCSSTDTLCTMNSSSLPAVVSTVNPTPTVSGSASPQVQEGSTNLWSQGALDALGGVWSSFYHWAGQTIQYVEDWSTETLGFMWVTPAALTYKNQVVHTGLNWMLGLSDGVLMIILVLGGYQCLIRTVLGEPRQEVMGFLFRVLIAAVVANVASLYVIPQLIELNNTLCAGSFQVFLHTGTGDFQVPFFGGANWLLQPITWGVFLLVDFVLALLLSLSMLVRLGLFIVTYILSVIGILLLASDSLRAWGLLWCRLFFFTLFIQFLQVLVVAIGSAFCASFFTLGSEGSLSPTTLFVGIATLYLAFKLPQMLMQPVVGAIYGDVQQGLSLFSMLQAIAAA